MTSTGYDGPGEEPFVGVQQWFLKKWLSPIAGKSVVGILEIIEDEKRTVLGYLEFRNEAEFEWFKERADGERRVERAPE